MGLSYLFIGLLAVAAGLLAALAAGPSRWLVLASGALAAPAGLGDVLFVPEYWAPVHVLGAWFSLEGLLFSFGNGCLIMALALPRGAPVPAPPADPGPALARLSWVMFPGFGVFLLAWLGTGLMVMHAVFVAFAAMFALLARWRGLSAGLSLRGGAGFLLVYALETLVWLWIDPAFTGFWGGGAYLWRLPFPPGIPAEEYLWAAAYGALWASMMGYGFGLGREPAAPARIRA